MVAYAVQFMANAVHQVRLLMNKIGYAVNLIANVVHPSGPPDVLYIIFSTVHLMANIVHPSVAMMMALAVQFMANVVHPSESPEV